MSRPTTGGSGPKPNPVLASLSSGQGVWPVSGSRPGTGVSLNEMEVQIKGENAVIIQRVCRRFVASCRLHKLLNARIEKIWDPRRRQFYYYDKTSDMSTWARPRLLRHHDIKDVAPTYTRTEAATMIQCMLFRRVALRRVRMLYQAAIIATYDESSAAYYYFNPATSYTTWDLPNFMGKPGRIDYEYDKLPPTVRWGPDGIISPDSDGDSEDSDVSVESAIVRQRRKARRKFPRSKAQSLMDGVEDNFVMLRMLNMSNLGASRITSRLFDMTNLTALNLSSNQLGPRLSSNIQYLIKLQSLDLSHNNFEKLPKSLEELVVLRELRVSHNLLSTYSGYLYKLSTLQVFDLSHNLFKDLPVETGNLELFKFTRQWDVGIQCLKNVAVLKLNHNLFEVWPTQMEKCVRLKEIDLSYNMLSSVSMLVGAHSILTRLDLSFNRISKLPPELYRLPALQKLYLNNNFLDDLPPLDESAISGLRLSELQELDLSFNKLTKLDARMAVFTGMRRFNANDNQIASIDDSIGSMAHITHLNLARNHIEVMPPGFGGCKSLVNLELQFNKLTVIPLCMSTMKNLAHLKMHDNEIADATTQVFGMTSSMVTIDLHNNKIPRLPVTWYTMTKLVSMDVSYNLIEGPIPRGLGGLKELEKLLMRDNLITELPESISNVTNLRILELENNMISPSLPLGVSRLQKLWRVTTRFNNFEQAPSGLFHLPLLQSWDLSWNQRIVAQFIDWQERERIFSDATEMMPVKMLRRLIARGWTSLDSQRRPSTLDYVSGAALANTTSSATITSSVDASLSSSDPVADKKRNKKQSKKALREARRARKQALSDLMSWHNALKSHFKSHLTIYRPVSKVGGALARRRVSGVVSSVGQTANAVSLSSSLSRVASSTFLADEQRRTRTQLLSLFRVLHLTSATRAREPGSVADFDSSPVPDAELVESLDLGARFQEAIEYFETAARNICAMATLRYAEQAQARVVALREEARRRRAEILAKAARSKKALFADEPPAVGGLENLPPDPTLLSARSLPALSARSNTSEGKALLALAIGESGAIGNQELEDGVDDAFVEVDYVAMPKSAIVSPSGPAFMQQYPVLNSLSDAEMHGLAFDAYLGMGSALLKRADCLALAVRDVERRGQLPISLLGVSHRLDDDFEDLAADDYQEMIDRLAVAEEQKGSSIVARKKARMAALMAKSGVADRDIDIDEDDEDSAKAKKEAKKKSEVEQLEKKRLQNRAELEKKRKEAEAEAEEERLLEEEGGVAEDDAPATTLEDPNAISENTARVVAQFLFEHRKITLVWANKALDAASELLKMRGWDATITCALFAAERAAVIETGSDRLARDAMDLYLARARALQLTDNHKAALEEYSACVRVSRGKFFRAAAIECVKVRLADSDYAAARSSLVDFVTNEVPDADRRFPEPHELYKSDRRLALLLMLCNAGLDQMRRAGVWAPEKTLTFRVLENGLPVTPPPIRESELNRMRNPHDQVVIAERLARVEQENVAWAKDQELLRLKDKIQSTTHKYKVHLEASQVEMEKIQQDLLEKSKQLPMMAGRDVAGGRGRGVGGARGGGGGRDSGGRGDGRGDGRGAIKGRGSSLGTVNVAVAGGGGGGSGGVARGSNGKGASSSPIRSGKSPSPPRGGGSPSSPKSGRVVSRK